VPRPVFETSDLRIYVRDVAAWAKLLRCVIEKNLNAYSFWKNQFKQTGICGSAYISNLPCP
jgi:hypothetical protein